MLISQKLMEFGKSFTYMENNKGPNIDPWGTPIVIYPLDERALLTLTC